MPNYCFICPKCGLKYEKYFNIKDNKSVKCECGEQTNRDFKSEFSGVGIIADGWEEGGYNYGLGKRYKNKADLMRQIYEAGFEPSLHDNPLTKVKRPLYFDEKRKIEHDQKSSIKQPLEIEVE